MDQNGQKSGSLFDSDLILKMGPKDWIFISQNTRISKVPDFQIPPKPRVSRVAKLAQQDQIVDLGCLGSQMAPNGYHMGPLMGTPMRP